MIPWHTQRMAALDFESSDKDPETARIVTCALILVGDGVDPDTRTWLLNPGIPMEPGAIEKHKITDEYAAKHGMPAEQGVAEIAKALAEVVAAGVPIVGHNVGGYDLNLLNHECARRLGDSLEGICRQPLTRVIDSMICDWWAAPFRKRVSKDQGSYEMKTTAQTYGLGWDDDAAHEAKYDALMSARAAWHMGNIAHLPRAQRPEWVQNLRNRRGPYDRFDDLAGVDVEELHRRQIGWAAERAAGLQEHFRKKDPAAVVEGAWPLVPFKGVSA